MGAKKVLLVTMQRAAEMSPYDGKLQSESTRDMTETCITMRNKSDIKNARRE